MGQDAIPTSLSFPESAQFARLVGRSPWTAADALVGSLRKKLISLQKSGPGGPARTTPHRRALEFPSFGETKTRFGVVLTSTRCITREYVRHRASLTELVIFVGR